MPGVVRQTDICTGHGAYPPRASISGSPNVNVNNLPAHRKNDLWEVHSQVVPPPAPHGGFAQTGSGTVRVNGLPLCRIGDQIASTAEPHSGDQCDSLMATGSGDVRAG